MNKKGKRIIRKPLEEAKEFVEEAKRQIKAKTPPEEEMVGGGRPMGKKRRQHIQEKEEEELREARMEKAKMLGEWRQRYKKIQEEELKAAEERREKEAEKKRWEEMEKKKKEEEKPRPSGEEAITATGAAQKRPAGLWGIGKKFKKMFKWFTSERKGRAPR